MYSLSVAELLEIWDRGLTQAPPVRALALLAAASRELTPEQLAALSIGERDARLIALREALFGPDLEAIVTCPQCGEQLELSFSTRDLQSHSKPDAERDVTVSLASYDLRLRPPNSRDLLEIGNEEDAGQASKQILRRCLLSANHSGATAEFEELSEEVLQAAAGKIAEIDPLADIRLIVACPACQHEWRAVFDIVPFLWAEVEAWAGRMLNEVHTLASAYGWAERDILALSPARRQIYLDMVGA